MLHLQDSLADGAQVHLVLHDNVTDLTPAFLALLALLPPTSSLLDYSTSGRRPHERIITIESFLALREALDRVVVLFTVSGLE